MNIRKYSNSSLEVKSAKYIRASTGVNIIFHRQILLDTSKTINHPVAFDGIESFTKFLTDIIALHKT